MCIVTNAAGTGTGVIKETAASSVVGIVGVWCRQGGERVNLCPRMLHVSRTVRRLRNFCTFHPNGPDYFALLDFHLLVAGVRIKSNRIGPRLLFKLYQLLLPLQYCIWLYRTWAAAYVECNITLAMSLCCASFVLTSIVIRHALMWASFGQFGPVRDYINGRRNERGTRESHQVRRQALRLNNTLVRVAQFYCLVNLVIYESFSLHRHEVFRMPDHLERSNAPLAGLLRTIMGLLVGNWLWSFSTNFLNLHAMLTGLQAEFRLVVHSFERLLAGVDAQVQRETGTLRTPDVHRDREELFWTLLDRRMRTCVHEHSEVLTHIREVIKIISFSLMVQYYTTLLSLAIDTFFILYNGFDFVTYMVVIFTLLLVVEWYYCCKLVENLQATHKRIGWTLYNENWPARLRLNGRNRAHVRKLRDTLSIILLASHRSLSFHGSSIIEVSWETFGNLFKTSYSVLMFLIELRKVAR